LIPLDKTTVKTIQYSANNQNLKTTFTAVGSGKNGTPLNGVLLLAEPLPFICSLFAFCQKIEKSPYGKGFSFYHSSKLLSWFGGDTRI
jgi:hypothetical protein